MTQTRETQVPAVTVGATGTGAVATAADRPTTAGDIAVGAKGSPSTHPAAALSAQAPRVKALRRFALSITALTVAGHVVLGFEQAPLVPVVTALVAYALEILLETVDARARRRPARYRGGVVALVDFLLPTHIAALATAMLLWGSSVLWPYLLAVSIAVTVKYLVKAPVNGRWRHTLNPSNTGIAVTLLLFGWVGIAPPYMFTASVVQPVDSLVPLVILVLGTMLNVRLTRKWPLILGWVGGFVAQAALRALLLDADLLGALAPLTGVVFVLFSNYMITDPGSTPTRPRNQVVFGLTCAAAYGVLMTLHVSFGLFFALVTTCVLRTLLLHAVALRDRTSRPGGADRPPVAAAPPPAVAVRP